jgi:hypothetical protein
MGEPIRKFKRDCMVPRICQLVTTNSRDTVQFIKNRTKWVITAWSLESLALYNDCEKTDLTR